MKKKRLSIPPRIRWIVGGIVAVILLIIFAGRGCSSDKAPVAHLAESRDSLPVMTSIGVSSLISDSGYTRYRIIAEKWEMYDKTNPPRNVFPDGLFVQRLDNQFNMDLYIVADSAWCFNQNLWRFKGNVLIKDINKKTTFSTQELFWNREEHRFYSNTYMKITEPTQQLEGNRFWANEQLTQYEIHKGKGYMPMPSGNSSPNHQQSTEETPSEEEYIRTPEIPRRKDF